MKVVRTMFSSAVLRDDRFLSLSASAQMLYIQLSLDADDDGFVGNPQSVIRICGCSDADFSALVERRYILTFDSGICVIKHWRMNNTIRADRYRPTNYTDEWEQIEMKGNKAYTEVKKHPSTCDGNHWYTNGQPRATTGIPTVATGKVRRDVGTYKVPPIDEGGGHSTRPSLEECAGSRSFFGRLFGGGVHG